MAVNNYTRNCQYNLNNLDNYIYLYEFNQPILDYITDDEESNGSSISLSSTSYRIFCESVSYSSTSTVDNRFSFENTLTVTLAEHKDVTHYKVIQTLLNNNWMVLFKNKEGDSFVMNAEYPVMVSYSYNFNDEKTPNTLTLTFKALQNVPTINYRGSVTFNSTLRDKPCEYTISRIKSLKMIDMNKGNISVSEDSFSIEQKGDDSLKTIEFNPTSLSFIDAYDGREFSQTLSFTIPFNSYLYYFHYNLLEYLDNRYYALIETTNGNNILSGFKQGLFPSYTISTSDSGNLITINLNAKYTTYSLLGSDTMNITTNDGFSYVPILGECVNNIYTHTLIEQINANGTPTNGYYCLNGFEDIYSDYTILGTYNQFDTTFGIKLTDFNIDCSEGCQIEGLPSSIQFKTSGETLCYDIETTCSVIWEWDNNALAVEYDDVNKRLCVTSISNEGTYSIKGTLTDGTIRYVTVIIGSGGVTGDTTTTINITAEAQTVSVIPSKGFANVKSIYTSLQYVINENGNGYNVSVDENPNEYSRLFSFAITYNDDSIELVNIVQNQIYYSYIATNDTECFGEDLYYINQKYKGYTEDKINIFVENVKGNLKESKSENCLDYDDKTSACTACFEGYVYTLYNYTKDGNVVATKYEKTNETCSNNGTTEYIINTAKTACVDYIAYYVEELYGVSCEDNTTKIILNPIIERTSTTEAPNSDVCDVIDPSASGNTLYRWIDTDETYCLPSGASINCITSSITNTYCNGKNLYGDIEFYIDTLCDGNKVLMSSQERTLIEYDSVDCGGSGSSGEGTYGDLIYLMRGNVSFYTLNNVRYTGTSENSIDNGDGTYIHSASLVDLGVSTLTNMNFSWEYNKGDNDAIVSFIKFPDVSHITDMSYMFANLNNVTDLDLTSFNTSQVTNMKNMFGFSVNLRNINVSSFDTSNVTDMSSMFQGGGIIDIDNDEAIYDQLTTLDLSNFNTSAVTDMSDMFYRCVSLTNLNISSFDTSNVLNMNGMFGSCKSMFTIDLSHFNTSKVTNMDDMFVLCENLQSIDLSSWDVSNVESIHNMFYGCYSLKTVNLTGWDITNIIANNTNGHNKTLFEYCDSLSKVILGNITQEQYNFWYGTVVNKSVLEYTIID